MQTLTRLVLAGTRGLNRASIVAVGILTLVLTVVVLLQVLYRYVLELPLVWSDEAARLLLVWLTFVGGGVAIAQGLHPRIEMIDSIRAPGVRTAIEVVVSVAVLAFLVCLLVISADVAKTYVAYRSLGLGWSQAIPRAAIPVGACLMAINVLAKLLEVLNRHEAIERRGAA
jgi:TRAP-type C4-dicarboxylate transport system permease small subunit